MSAINRSDYIKSPCISHVKFSPQQFFELRYLSSDTVGISDSILDVHFWNRAISATVIYTEYISNFPSPHKFWRRISCWKNGKTWIISIKICLTIIHFDMIFASYYARKHHEDKPHKSSTTHVAKKLIRVIFALEKDIDFNSQNYANMN